MRKMVIAIFAVASLAAAPVSLQASPCKDAKGKFIKCPPKAPVKKGPCKDAKGKFIKCK